VIRLKTKVKVYDKQTIDTLPWPTTEEGDYARRFLVPLIKNGASSYLHNVQTEMFALAVDHLVLPLTVNTAEYDNSFVCSPYTHFVTAAGEEVAELRSPWLKKLMGSLFRTLKPVLQGGELNKVVHVNNWLLPTNLYPTLTAQQIHDATLYLQTFFPDHAILFRSINRYYDGELAEDLQSNGYQLLPSRLVYIWNAADESAIRSKARWILKQDFRRLSVGDYQVVSRQELGVREVPRIAELYNRLYIGKHSPFNPQYSEAFVELLLREGLLQVIALREHGRIDAALGFFCRNGVISSPLFGYDTEMPKEMGLYRMLSALLVMEARKRSLLLHQSAGADEFKKCRGAVATIEYSAVYDRHLPWHRRLPWWLLSTVIHKVMKQKKSL